MSKALVAYFSATSTTARVAKKLAESIRADLFVIEPETPYTSKDLNWNDPRSRTTAEKKDLTGKTTVYHNSQRKTCIK